MPLPAPRTRNPMVTLLRVSDRRIRMQALFGPKPPTQSGGYSGWKTIDRPQKRAMTEWQGPQPLKAQLQIMFDGYSTAVRGNSQTRPIAYFQRHFASLNGNVEPEPFRVLGAWPIDDSIQWVIDDVAPDDDVSLVVVRQSDRVPLRALYTLSLMQFVPGDVIVKSTAAKRAKDRGSKAKTRSYVVRKGDTLGSIAAKLLGAAKRADEIQKLNPGVRDPKKLKPGLRLKVPA